MRLPEIMIPLGRRFKGKKVPWLLVLLAAASLLAGVAIGGLGAGLAALGVVLVPGYLYLGGDEVGPADRPCSPAPANRSDDLRELVEKRYEHTALSNASNSENYQIFRRRLSVATAKTMAETVPGLFGYALGQYPLVYMAHAACMVEDRCQGRLATDIETFLIRAIVAGGLPGSKVHVLEIGSLFGIGLAALYEVCARRYDDFTMTAIDPLDGYYGEECDVITGIPVNERIFHENMQRAHVPQAAYRIIKRRSDDPEAVREASRHRYDLLIIDGDHAQEAVQNDWRHYAPLVRVGGYVIFDDYDAPDWPAVRQVVDAEVLGQPGVQAVYSGFRCMVIRIEASFA